VCARKCIGFEDSISGITALGKAGVKCIEWVQPYHKEVKRGGLKFTDI
jgi:beta-phosphoglucomutase-like phosphatase (HAD superfamily)